MTYLAALAVLVAFAYLSPDAWSYLVGVVVAMAVLTFLEAADCQHHWSLPLPGDTTGLAVCAWCGERRP